MQLPDCDAHPPPLINLSVMLLKQIDAHAHFTSSLLLKALGESEAEAPLVRRPRAFTCHQNSLGFAAVIVSPQPFPVCAVFELACSPAFLALALLQS